MLAPLVDSLLAVEGLDVERGGRLVLSGLSFALSAGETLLVSGRNGAGKSTLLRTLAGLLHPHAGAIRCGLADEETRGVEAMHYLGYEDALKPSLTVGENLAFWASMLGAPAKPPSPPSAVTFPRFAGRDLPPEAALAAYGIARLHDLPAAYLSAGQTRRVALARLLLASRPIWLLDEPLIALDAVAQERTVEIMAAHTRAGGAILVASHQPLVNTTGRIELDVA